MHTHQCTCTYIKKRFSKALHHSVDCLWFHIAAQQVPVARHLLRIQTTLHIHWIVLAVDRQLYLQWAKHTIVLTNGGKHTIVLTNGGKHTIVLTNGGKHTTALTNGGNHTIVLTNGGKHTIVLTNEQWLHKMTQRHGLKSAEPSRRNLYKRVSTFNCISKVYKKCYRIKKDVWENINSIWTRHTLLYVKQ